MREQEYGREMLNGLQTIRRPDRTSTITKMQLRPFPLRSFQCLWLLLSLLAMPAMAQPQRTYTGMLDGRLHVDANILGFAVWNEEVAAVEHKLDVPLHPGDRLFAGKLGLSSTLTFQGAIVRSQDGKDVLYLDTNRDGR